MSFCMLFYSQLAALVMLLGCPSLMIVRTTQCPTSLYTMRSKLSIFIFSCIMSTLSFLLNSLSNSRKMEDAAHSRRKCSWLKVGKAPLNHLALLVHE